MNREFVFLAIFDKNWKRLNLTDDDQQELETILKLNPLSGNVIENTGGLRKMRFALPNKGKSGSVRVLYVDFAVYEQLYFINVYPKNEQETITNEEKKLYKKIITEAEKILKNRGK